MATYDNLDTLVASVVGEVPSSEVEIDLSCTEIITDDVILDDTASVKSRKCSQTKNGCDKFKSRDKTFRAEATRALKREHLLPDDADCQSSHKKHTKRDQKQKSLLDGPLVPIRPTTDTAQIPDFLQQVRKRMISVSLYHILMELTYLLDLHVIYLLLDVYQADQRTIDTWTVESRETLQQFILTAQEALIKEPGIQYLQHSTRIENDRSWSTTLCGIVTKKTVTAWFANSMLKIDPAVYTPTPSSVNPFISSVATTSKASATCMSSTTVSGPVVNAAAVASIGTAGTMLTDGLLQHARLTQKTGCASSIIYVADSDQSYKYASESRNGDIQLDFRLYKMQDVMTQNQSDLWRHSIIRGKIAARSETQNGMLPDPVYTAIQNLVKAVQTAMTSDATTEVTRLGSQWKKSKE